MEIEQIIRDNGTYIYNYAFKLTCHPQKAEDLAQETFIRAWEKLSQLKEQEALKKWLRTICYHIFLMDCRKQNLQLELVDETEILEREGRVLAAQPALPEEEVVVSESIRDLQNGCFYAMVRRLTLSQRIAFSLVDMFGMPMKETADILEISDGALKGLLYRARMNLDSFFADHCNLIAGNNPCSCEAWINFREKHTDNKKKMKTSLETLDYTKKNYGFDADVRTKISWLYQHMPEQRPSQDWFNQVIQAVSA